MTNVSALKSNSVTKRGPGADRDYELAAALSRMDDATLVGLQEVAALLHLAPATVRKPEVMQRLGLGEPLPGVRHLRWPLGVVRAAVRRMAAATTPPAPARRIGRPTKAQQIERERAAIASSAQGQDQ